MCFGDCDVCDQFHGENTASPYKRGNLELICSACHMDGTESSETHLCFCAHLTVDSILHIIRPAKVYILAL